MFSIFKYAFLVLTEPHYFLIRRPNNGMLGIIQTTGTIVGLEEAPSDWMSMREMQTNDQIFSINNRNVLGEETYIIHGALQGGGKTLEIGVLRPKQFDSNTCKSS